MEVPLSLVTSEKGKRRSVSHNQWLSANREQTIARDVCMNAQVQVLLRLKLPFVTIAKCFNLKRYKIVTYMEQEKMWWLSTRIVLLVRLIQLFGFEAQYKLVY